MPTGISEYPWSPRRIAQTIPATISSTPTAWRESTLGSCGLLGLCIAAAAHAIAETASATDLRSVPTADRVLDRRLRRRDPRDRHAERGARHVVQAGTM